jgi:hypothetical protein
VGLVRDGGPPGLWWSWRARPAPRCFTILLHGSAGGRTAGHWKAQCATNGEPMTRVMRIAIFPVAVSWLPACSGGDENPSQLGTPDRDAGSAWDMPWTRPTLALGLLLG